MRIEGKQIFEFGIHDMYAIKHSLEKTIKDKRLELLYLKQHESHMVFRIDQLEKDIEREEGLITIMGCEIGVLKRKNQRHHEKERRNEKTYF